MFPKALAAIFFGFFTSSSMATVSFVDWTSTTEGTLPGGVTVSIVTGGSAVIEAAFTGGTVSFAGSTYSPPQINGDALRARFSSPGDTVTIQFSSPVSGLFMHSSNAQTLNNNGIPQNIYSFDLTPTKLSGTADWAVDGNSLRILSGDLFTAADGTIGFTGAVSSLTITRTAPYLFGSSDAYTFQVGAIPEPDLPALLLIGSLGLIISRKRHA
ncbi:MAG: hypothetical protein AAGJ79_13210 [Verrucomicrobiota bacterium]